MKMKTKIINFFKKIWNFIVSNLKDKTTFIIFLIVLAIFGSPIVLGYILGIILKNAWFIGIATTCLAIWAGPGTPIFPLILIITIAIRNLIKIIFNDNTIDTIIFDIDGTLIDSEKYTISSKIIEGKKYGYNISEEVVINSLGMAKAISKEYYMNIFGDNFPYDELRVKRTEYIINALNNNEVEYKKGAHELIEYLLKNKYKIALVSSSNIDLINEYKKHLDLFKNFEVIITGDDVKRGKPHPDGFFLAIKKLNSIVKKSLVIEDSKNGILAAKKGRIRSVFIEDYFKLNNEIKDNATYIFNDLSEVINLLEEQKNKKKRK